MTLTSVGSHLQPEVFRQIFKTFSFLKCVLRVKRAGDCWNYLPYIYIAIVLPSNWSDSYGATVLWTLCPLRTFSSQHPLLSYRKQVHHHSSFNCEVHLFHTCVFSLCPPDQLCRDLQEQVVEEWDRNKVSKLYLIMRIIFSLLTPIINSSPQKASGKAGGAEEEIWYPFQPRHVWRHVWGGSHHLVYCFLSMEYTINAMSGGSKL